MEKGLGIAGLVIAIVALFMPFGVFLSLFSAVLCCIGALMGERVFATATPLIGLFNLMFSPLTWLLLGVDAGSIVKFVFYAGVLSPFVAIAINASGRSLLRNARSTPIRDGSGVLPRSPEPL